MKLEGIFNKNAPPCYRGDKVSIIRNVEVGDVYEDALYDYPILSLPEPYAEIDMRLPVTARNGSFGMLPIMPLSWFSFYDTDFNFSEEGIETVDW